MSSLPDTANFSVKEADTQEVRYLGSTGPQSQLRFGATEGVFSPTAKFAVEPAANGLVHIRSCFLNNYWVRKSASSPWLSASAPEPVADKSEDGCTLFRPRMGPGNIWVSFVHIKSGLNVVMRPASDPHAYNLAVADAAPTEFGYIDYASLVKLPRYVMFMGDNDKYLAPRLGYRGRQYFITQSQTDTSVAYETFFTKSGDVRVKSRPLEAFWQSGKAPSSSMLVAANYPADSDPSIATTVFRLKPGGTTSQVAVSCPGSDMYVCIRDTSDGELMANPKDRQSAVIFTVFTLGEPSKSQVTVNEFQNHWVVNTDSQEPVTSTPVIFENESDQDVQEEILKDGEQHYPLRYSFTNSITHGQTSANFSTPMPYLTEQGQLEIPDEPVSLGPKDWGKFYYYDNNDFAHSPLITGPLVTVPAKTRVIATLFAKTATCEIPFSYEIKEEFYTGGGDTYDLHDGVFTGKYTYSYEVRIDQTEAL